MSLSILKIVVASKIKHERILKTAGWWKVNWDKTSPYTIGDEPADWLDSALKDIRESYRLAWKREPKIEELDALWKFCTGPYRTKDE